VSRELPESAINFYRSSGSFDYAPLSIETDKVVEALRSDVMKTVVPPRVQSCSKHRP
jgi:hypothetical protein